MKLHSFPEEATSTIFHGCILLHPVISENYLGSLASQLLSSTCRHAFSSTMCLQESRWWHAALEECKTTTMVKHMGLAQKLVLDYQSRVMVMLPV